MSEQALFFAISTACGCIVLHSFIATLVYPERHENRQAMGFFFLMVVCTFHDAGYALSQIGVLTDSPNVHYWARVSLLFTESAMSLAPIPILFSEPALKPHNNNAIVKAHDFLAAYSLPCVFLIAGGCFVFNLLHVTRGYPLLNPDPGSMSRIVSGFCFFSVSTLWTIMRFTGVRIADVNLTMRPENFALLAGGMLAVVFVTLFLPIQSLNREYFDTISLFIVLIMVPVAIFVAWFMFRLELIDSIVKQLLRFVIVVSAAWVAVSLISPIDPVLLPYVLLGELFTTALLLSKIGDWLEPLWMPHPRDQKNFSLLLPEILASCVTPQQAITETEELLARLFNTEVAINRPLPEPAQLLRISDTPPLELQLGQVKGRFPWLSESLNLVRTSGLYLSGHLKVLDALEEKRQQTIINQQLSEMAATAELSALRAQIRPHFLFNVLNSIHSLIKDDPDRAEHTLELLATLMRDSLHGANADTCLLSGEIAMASTYLAIEKVRYGKRLDFSIDVPPALNNDLVPTFSLQPLVENVIKHAVDQQSETTHIVIRATDKDGFLLLTVNDDGPGLRNATDTKSTGRGLGIALENIRQRLQRLYGDSASLTLNNRPEGGVRASIKLPRTERSQSQATEYMSDEGTRL